MKDYQREFPVGNMCKVINVSKSSFYNARNFIPSNRESENRRLLSEMMLILEQSKASYGTIMKIMFEYYINVSELIWVVRKL
jgi:hypothetical protein